MKGLAVGNRPTRRRKPFGSILTFCALWDDSDRRESWFQLNCAIAEVAILAWLRGCDGSVILEGDSLDSESNMYAWCLAVESVPPGDRCRAVRDEVLGAWRYVFSAKRFGGMMRLALELGIGVKHVAFLELWLGMTSLELSSGWRMNTRNP
ncbi:hypothetical protein DEO72_LG10g1945 [Vigna unguiculata]|uniref:Uncharacterized protein n=1 Tax=Vigna unguiculata TaxID=3917 RepID=A0A4D6ND85_VIGUN|nr:hypothetical protein DEO72_LG10g1945 [Vigna unguiculata]